MENRTVLIDICGTLFDSNTTLDFLDFLLCSRSYRLLRRMARSLPWRAFNRCCRRLTGRDPTREMLLRHLRGRTRQELATAAEAFYETCLAARIRPRLQEIVAEVKAAGYEPCLASATLDCIARTVARRWRIGRCCSSELDYDGDRCTGRLRRDLLGRKLEYLKEAGILPPFAMTVTDDRSDMPLLRLSERVLVVTRRKRAARWRRALRKNRITRYQILCCQ